MYRETVSHLTLADRNRDLAKEMMNTNTATPSFAWVTVMAFYAAVHYVNAYLYEKQNQYIVTAKSGGHTDRTGKVRTLPDLQQAYPAYRNLSLLAYEARYEPALALKSRATAQGAIQDMEDVERIVMYAM